MKTALIKPREMEKTNDYRKRVEGKVEYNNGEFAEASTTGMKESRTVLFVDTETMPKSKQVVTLRICQKYLPSAIAGSRGIYAAEHRDEHRNPRTI